jgi:hypothetical protein
LIFTRELKVLLLLNFYLSGAAEWEWIGDDGWEIHEGPVPDPAPVTPETPPTEAPVEPEPPPQPMPDIPAPGPQVENGTDELAGLDPTPFELEWIEAGVLTDDGCWVNIRTGAAQRRTPTVMDHFEGQYFTYEDPCTKK